MGEGVVSERTAVDSFTRWAEQAETRLRRALTASFGPQVGEDAAVDALAHAWQHWDRIKVMTNPIGYVFGIGRSKALRMAKRRRPVFLEVPQHRLPEVEPGLPSALARLPEKQRIAVALLHGYQWTISEVAELLGTARSTVQVHAERGLARLRRTLGVDE